MKCTSPCQPACPNEATTELLSLTGSHLGFNCDQHIEVLRFVPTMVNGAKLQPEYAKRPINEDATKYICNHQGESNG